MTWREGVSKSREQLFDTIIKGKVVPVVKLRRAKVVVVVDGIHGRSQLHAFVPVWHRLVVIFSEKTLWRSIGGVEGVLCCFCGACIRCCFCRLPVKCEPSC